MESFSVNFNLKSESKELLKRTLKLLHNKKDSSSLVDSHECYKALSFVNFYLYCPEVDIIHDEILKILLEMNSLPMFKHLLIYLSAFYDQLNFDLVKPEPRLNYFYKATNINERRIYMMRHVISIFNQILPCSSDLRVKFSELDALRSLVDILRDDKFSKSLNTWSPSTFKGVVFNLNWISKSCEGFKLVWHRLESINVLLTAAKTNQDLLMYFYMIISNIAFDKEIENIPDIHFICDRIAMVICDCIRQPGGKLKQTFRDETTQNDLDFEIITWRDLTNNSQISVTALLLCLYRLAVNHRIKWEIYQRPYFKDSLKTLIINGNEVEKHYALELIAQLCFDDKVKQELNKDKELFEFVQRISLKEKFIFSQLRESSKHLIWNMKNADEKIANVKQLEKLDLKSQTKNQV